MLKKFRIFLLFLSIFSLIRAEIPEGYYPATLNGKKERELKTAFHLLLKDHTRIGYGGGMGGTWSVFRYSDAKSGGIVWNMYSNTVRYFTSGTYGATKGMNIEHSVPKSWWGDAADYNGTTPLTRFKYEASYDLHHLTPADADANEEKSNYPLGVVSTQSWTNGVTKVGTGYINGMPTNIFEPADEYKGDFARMYFYFVTCYQDYTCGNRNPFVDHPELAEYIWGTKTDEAFYLGAGITNWQTGDYFVFPNSTIGESVEKSFRIEGIQIASAVSLILDGDDKNMFSFAVSSLSADEVNAGTDVGATYMPSSAGLHKATLMLAADNIASVAVELRGVSIPQTIRRIVPVGLKLSETLPGCTWEGDGVSANVFTPEKAGKGTHTLRWKSSSGCGSVQVVVK